MTRSTIVLSWESSEGSERHDPDFVDDFVRVMEHCLNLVLEKTEGYGEAWRQQGWMGNLARIGSKTARLQSMLWGKHEKPGFGERVEDTALDLINLTVFFLLNRARDNQWGPGSGSGPVGSVGSIGSIGPK